MFLTETHIIKQGNLLFHELDNLCFLSKNLYNSTLYAVRQHYFQTQEYLNYNRVNALFTHSDQKDYRALPAKVSKWTQKLVEQDMKAFFALLKKKKDNNYQSRVHIPRYAEPIKGRKPVHYPKDALSFKKKPGFICLSQTNIAIKSKIPQNLVEFVNIVPHVGYIMICVGYKKDCSSRIQKKGGYASIDLGLNNLATVCSDRFRPLIINGRPLKSINQFFNKEKSRFQTQLPTGQRSSHRIDRLSLKRKNKIKDYLHKATSWLVNHLALNNIDTLVLGYNTEWKQDISLGTRNNQNFVSIPFHMFKTMLRYKCELQGIALYEQEESYTSKCSFLDSEEICKHKNYKGKRIKRGLFRTENSRLVNADLNGSLNILKKFLQKQEAWDEKIFSDLVEGCSSPNIQKISF